MNRLDSIEKTQLRESIPDFQSGDTVRVHVRIKESETKERLQAFEGVVIARKHGGARENHHRAQDELRHWRRANLSATRDHRGPHRRGEKRPGKTGETLLPARLAR